MEQAMEHVQCIDQMSPVCNDRPIMDDQTINYNRALHIYTNSEQGMTAYEVLFQHLASENYALVVAIAYW